MNNQIILLLLVIILGCFCLERKIKKKSKIGNCIDKNHMDI